LLGGNIFFMKYKMFILLLSLSLFTTACNKSEGEAGSGIDQSYAGITDGDFDVIPNEATTFETNVDLVNFESNRVAKMEEAIEIIKLVIATEEFKNKILNHTYNGAKTFVDNRGYSNAQIYKILLDGAEKLQPSKNNTMDAEVELYTASTNVVGYTYPSSKRIWVNTKYFDQYTAAGVAHNLMHEWMHKLGFEHSSSWNAARDYSVPYAVGDIMGEVGKYFL
jgi:hypothetical protein